MTERQRIINLAAAMATVFAGDVALGLTYPILNLILDARGVDVRLIGLNAAMSPLGLIVAGFVLPHVANRLESRSMALLGVAGLVLCMIVFPLTDDMVAWFFARFLLGFAACALYTVSEAWVMTFAREETRGRTTAIYTTIAATGFALGPFLIPFTGIEGWTPFVIGGASMALAALPILYVRVTRETFMSEHSAGAIRFARAAPVLLLCVLTLTFFDSIMLSFYAIYGLRSGLDLTTASWTLGVAAGGCAIFQYPVGWLADRWSRTGVLWIAALMTAAAALALPHAIGNWAIWPVSAALGIGAYSVYTIALIVHGSRFKGQMLMAGSAAIGTMWGIGGISGAPVGGFAIDAFGIGVFPYLLATTYGVLMLFLLLTRGRLVRPATA